MRWEDFDIAFVKYKPGTHTVDFVLNADFFSLFENSSYTHGTVDASVLLHRDTPHFKLDFSIKGNVETECDRCLENIVYPLKNSYTIHVKVTENPGEEVDNLVYLHPSEFKFNVAQYLYEMIHLAVPMKKVCEDIGNSCDPIVLAKIEGFSSEDLNDDTEIPSTPFEKLKDLFKDTK